MVHASMTSAVNPKRETLVFTIVRFGSTPSDDAR